MEEKKSGFFLPLLVLVVLVAAGYIFFSQGRGGEKMAGEQKQGEVATQNNIESLEPIPEATGNIDETAAAILLGASQDPSLSQEDSADASFVELDSDTIISYGQAYDETGI